MQSVESEVAVESPLLLSARIVATGERDVSTRLHPFHTETQTSLLVP